MHPQICLDVSRLKLREDVFAVLLRNSEDWDVLVIWSTKGTGEVTGNIVVNNSAGGLSLSSEKILLGETAVTTLDECKLAFGI